MNDKYLWDRSGPPDPEIERLEQALAPLRYRPRTNVVRQARPAVRVWWATAAAALLAGVAVWQIHAPAPRATEWQVARVEGTARMGRESAGVAMALRAGQTLRTGPASELRLQADTFGQIDLGPRNVQKTPGITLSQRACFFRVDYIVGYRRYLRRAFSRRTKSVERTYCCHDFS